MFSLNQKAVIYLQPKETEPQQGLIQDPRLSQQEVPQTRLGPQGFVGVTPPGLFLEGPLLDRKRWLGTADTARLAVWPPPSRPAGRRP